MWITSLLTSIGKGTFSSSRSRLRAGSGLSITPSSIPTRSNVGAVAKTPLVAATVTDHTQKRDAVTSDSCTRKHSKGRKENDTPSVASTIANEEPTDLGSACGLGGVQSIDSDNPAREMVDQTERRIKIRGTVHTSRMEVPKVDRSLAVRELASGWFWQYAGDGYGTAVSEREAFIEALLHVGVETKISPLTRDDELEFVLAQSIANLQVKK